MSDAMSAEFSPQPRAEMSAINILPIPDVLVSEAASELQPVKEKLVKRKISKWHAARVAFAGAFIPFMLSCIQVSPTPSPTPRQLPDAQPAAIYLKQTVTALEATGQRNSFREEAGFTKEMFESVRRGTFMISVVSEKEIEGKKEFTSMNGSAWLAQAEGNTYYVVTNRHIALPEGGRVTQVVLRRPELDTEKFIFTSVKGMTFMEGPDIAVLELEGNYQTSTPLEPLKWQDNFLLKEGDKALVVGFPQEFWLHANTSNDYTQGTVATILEDLSPGTADWNARALINVGSSGSPAVINKKGQVVAVGIIYGHREWVVKNNETEIQKQQVAFGTPLDIGSLINALKAQTE